MKKKTGQINMLNGLAICCRDKLAMLPLTTVCCLPHKKPVSAFYSFVYLNDSLIYWDNNAVSFAYNQVKNGINQQLIQLKNGWYELFRYQRRNITIIGLLPISCRIRLSKQVFAK
jgi:hypothetical protein